jgi:hypothetical protein
MRVQSNRRRSIARGCAGAGLCADHFCMAERRRHSVILERAGGIQPFVLEKQSARLHIDIFGDRVILLKDGLAFADGDFVFIVAEIEQLAESPHAGEVERVVFGGPPPRKIAQLVGNTNSIPVVLDIEQLAALRALEAIRYGPTFELSPAIGIDALLIGPTSHILTSRTSYLVVRLAISERRIYVSALPAQFSTYTR